MNGKKTRKKERKMVDGSAVPVLCHPRGEIAHTKGTEKQRTWEPRLASASVCLGHARPKKRLLPLGSPHSEDIMTLQPQSPHLPARQPIERQHNLRRRGLAIVETSPRAQEQQRVEWKLDNNEPNQRYELSLFVRSFVEEKTLRVCLCWSRIRGGKNRKNELTNFDNSQCHGRAIWDIS